MNSRPAVIIASLAVAACMAPAPAAHAMEQGFYVGGYYGALERDAEESETLALFVASSALVYDDLLLNPVSFNPRLSEEDRSFGFVAGFRWLPNLAFELQYLDLGELRYRSEDPVIDTFLTPPIADVADTRFDVENSAFAISALGIWPLTYEWELFARGGFAITNTEGVVRVRTSSFGVAGGDEKDDVDWVAGIGLSYTFLDVYTLRAEAQRVFDAGHEDIGPQSDIDLVSLSILVTF